VTCTYIIHCNCQVQHQCDLEFLRRWHSRVDRNAALRGRVSRQGVPSSRGNKRLIDELPGEECHCHPDHAPLDEVDVPEDECDRAINLLSTRNAYYMLGIGFWTVPVMLLMSVPTVTAINVWFAGWCSPKSFDTAPLSCIIDGVKCNGQDQKPRQEPHSGVAVYAGRDDPNGPGEEDWGCTPNDYCHGAGQIQPIAGVRTQDGAGVRHSSERNLHPGRSRYRLIVTDVGQNLFEEINYVVNGGNYGWVISEGFHCFDPFSPTNPPLPATVPGYWASRC